MVWHQPVPVFWFLIDQALLLIISFALSVYLKIIFYLYSIHLYIPRIWTRIKSLAHNRSPTNVKLKWQWLMASITFQSHSFTYTTFLFAFNSTLLNFNINSKLFVGIFGSPFPVRVLYVINIHGFLLLSCLLLILGMLPQPLHCPGSIGLIP